MGGTTNLPPGATASEKVEYRAALQMLVQSVQAQVDNLAEIGLIRQRKQEFADSVRNWTGFAEPPPYSILLADDLRDQARAIEDQIRLAQDALAFIDKLDDNAEASLKLSDGGLRRISEQLEQAETANRSCAWSGSANTRPARNRMALATQASLDLVRQKLEEENRRAPAEARVRAAPARRGGERRAFFPGRSGQGDRPVERGEPGAGGRVPVCLPPSDCQRGLGRAREEMQPGAAAGRGPARARTPLSCAACRRPSRSRKRPGADVCRGHQRLAAAARRLEHGARDVAAAVRRLRIARS